MFRLVARDLAIDLGTANTLIYEKGKGIILNEPTIIAIKIDGNQKMPVAFGSEAKTMLGRTTDIAVISLKDIVYSLSVREGGDAMDEAIINHMRRRHHLLIGEATAELIKKTVGSAHPQYDNQEMEVRGRSLISGAPGAIKVT